MPFPRTRQEIDALPYRLQYGHWGLTASTGDARAPKILATANFPVSTRGPFDPPHVQDAVFAELDGKARAALEA